MIDLKNDQNEAQVPFLFRLAESYKIILDQIKPLEEEGKKLRLKFLELMGELEEKKKENGKLEIKVAYRDTFDVEWFIGEHPEHESLAKKIIKTELQIEKKDLKKLEKYNPALFENYNKRTKYLTVSKATWFYHNEDAIIFFFLARYSGQKRNDMGLVQYPSFFFKMQDSNRGQCSKKARDF